MLLRSRIVYIYCKMQMTALLRQRHLMFLRGSLFFACQGVFIGFPSIFSRVFAGGGNKKERQRLNDTSIAGTTLTYNTRRGCTLTLPHKKSPNLGKFISNANKIMNHHQGELPEFSGSLQRFIIIIQTENSLIRSLNLLKNTINHQYLDLNA